MPVHYLCPHQCHPSKVVDAACLAAGPAGHAGVTAATVLSEGKGWHEDKVLNVAADVLKEGPRSGGLRGHLQVGVR